MDLRNTGEAAWISDYKTGQVPNNAARTVVGQGLELQRILYALAVRQLLPNVKIIVSRLMYLDGAPDTFPLEGEVLENGISTVSNYLAIACRSLRSGAAAPGPDATDRYNNLRLALPADLESYLDRKRAAFGEACRKLSPLWKLP
jgi:hypothetical protein